MSGIEWLLLLGLGLPIVLLCGLFVVLACRMQQEENERAQRQAAVVHRRRRAVSY